MLIRSRFGLALLALGVLLRVAWLRLVRGPKHPRWRFLFELVAEIARSVMRRGFANIDAVGIGGGGRRAGRAIPAELAGKVVCEPTTHAGLRTEVHTPEGWAPGAPTLLYLHGGGYVTCSPGTHRELIARIAGASGARAVAVDYRKAPRHPYPAAVEDALGAYRELLAAGVAPGTLFVGGDSAGGGLTLTLLQRLRDAGEPLPRAALLLSPWVDLEGTGESVRSNAAFDYLSEHMLSFAAQAYLGGADRRDPLVSAVHADLRGLPPLLVQTGGAELFLSENTRFVERAREHRVDITHEIEDGMVHVFQVFAQISPEARSAIERIGRYVRERSLPAAIPAAAAAG